jgi:hypothetical protein
MDDCRNLSIILVSDLFDEKVSHTLHTASSRQAQYRDQAVNCNKSCFDTLGPRNRFVSSPKSPDCLWDSHRPPFNGRWGCFPGSKATWR